MRNLEVEGIREAGLQRDQAAGHGGAEEERLTLCGQHLQSGDAHFGLSQVIKASPPLIRRTLLGHGRGLGRQSVNQSASQRSVSQSGRAAPAG